MNPYICFLYKTPYFPIYPPGIKHGVLENGLFNGPFISDFHMKAYIWRGFSSHDYQRYIPISKKNQGVLAQGGAPQVM